MPTPTPTPTPRPGEINVSSSQVGCYLENKWSLLQDCVFPGITASMGGSDPLFGLLLGGTIMGTMYIADDQGRLGAPAAVLVLLGGALLPMLPGDLRGMAWTLIILGLAAGIGVIGHRYFLNVGVQP